MWPKASFSRRLKVTCTTRAAVACAEQKAHIDHEQHTLQQNAVQYCATYGQAVLTDLFLQTHIPLCCILQPHHPAGTGADTPGFVQKFAWQMQHSNDHLDSNYDQHSIGNLHPSYNRNSVEQADRTSFCSSSASAFGCACVLAFLSSSCNKLLHVYEARF